MALASKKTPRKLIKGRTDGLLDNDKETRASASMAGDVFSQDAAYVDGNLTPIMYHADLIQEDVDELRRYVTNDISGGSGGGPIIIGRAGGRFQWSSSDDGERCGLNTTYGPFFYNHTSEPSSGGRTYSASDAIDSATYTDNAYKVAIAGIPVLTTGKKIKVHYSFRVQNMDGSTVGLSLWSADLGSTPTTSSPTHTLRGKTDDISGGSSSLQVHHGSFTTTSTISDSHVVILGEHRAGSLTTNSYMYFALTFELVD